MPTGSPSSPKYLLEFSNYAAQMEFTSRVMNQETAEPLKPDFLDFQKNMQGHRTTAFIAGSDYEPAPDSIGLS